MGWRPRMTGKFWTMRWTVKRENKKQCSLFNIRRGKRVKDLVLLVLNSQVSVHSSCSLASCRAAATIKSKTNYALSIWRILFSLHNPWSSQVHDKTVGCIGASQKFFLWSGIKILKHKVQHICLNLPGENNSHTLSSFHIHMLQHHVKLVLGIHIDHSLVHNLHNTLPLHPIG